MTDVGELRITYQLLVARLEIQPHGNELRAVYLDLAPVIGQLQAAVSGTTRVHEEGEDVQLAQQALDRVKASSKKVGLDMRLSSESALLVGLQTVLQNIDETLDALERLG